MKKVEACERKEGRSIGYGRDKSAPTADLFALSPTLLRERKALRDMKQDREFFKDEVPLACTLIGSEQVTRREEVGDLFKDVLQVNELVDGYALCFPGSDGWANKLVQFITFERGCCPFFTFELAFEPKQGPIWLHLRGPEGGKS